MMVLLTGYMALSWVVLRWQRKYTDRCGTTSLLIMIHSVIGPNRSDQALKSGAEIT